MFERNMFYKEEKQYSGIYRLPQRKTGISKASERLRAVSVEQLALLSNIKYRPPNIGYFENILLEPEKQFSGKEVLVGVYCNMVPVEIISSMGGHALRLGCGNPASVSIGEEIIPGDVCPLVKASVGLTLTGNSVHSRCSAYIIPTSCDAKKKLGEILSDFKPVFMLNLPPEQNTYLYLKQSAFELERMIRFLEKELNLKFNRRKLICEIRKSNRKTLLMRRIQELRNSHPHILSIRDLMLIVQASYFDHSEKYLEELDKVLAWFEEGAKSISAPKFRKKRLIITGAPLMFPNFKALNIIEESGAEIVADTLCTGVQSVFDPIVTDEGWTGALLRSLAMRYIFACICPCFISQETRLNRIIDLSKDFKADGVINHALRLCQLCDMENYRLHQILRKNKIPVLDLRTDYSLEDTEQLRVRVEAFLETI